MAQLDVFRTSAGDYLLNCQSDLLNHLDTRFVIPLLSPSDGPKIAQYFNPTFQINGELMALYTQFALTVPAIELRDWVTSLTDQHLVVMRAIDMLVSGY